MNRNPESEIEHLKLLLSSSPAVTYTSEPSGDYAATYISGNVTDLIGHQPTDFTENPHFWSNNIHLQDREQIFKEMHHLFKNDTHIHEYRFQHRDGSYLWMLDEMKLIRDDDGNPQEIIGSWIDITSRKRAELALEQSEKRYRSFVHNFQGIAYRGTTDFTPIFFHGAVKEITGYSENDFISGNPTWDKVIYPDDLPKAFEDGEKMRSVPGFSYQREYRIHKKNGEIVWVYEIAQNVCDSSGTPRFVEGTIYDITDRKSTEFELAAQKEHLAVTLKSIGDGVITTNVEREVILVNKVAEELTGWSQEEATGQQLAKVFNLINETAKTPSLNPVAKVLNKNQTTDFSSHTALLVARDGTERQIASSGEPITDHNNQTVGFVFVFRDVTAQLRIEKELTKVKKLESIGVLAGGIAHDFNNILAAILGNINLALFDADLKEGTRNLLANAEKASLRARDLTQQLLTFAKGGDPVREASSLGNIIKDSANFILHGGNVGCQFNIPADLWLADIDKGQISQVIQNIILN
ncbi:MAG: PAS domain-containing protein, partial [Desulforhopalus sp.]